MNTPTLSHREIWDLIPWVVNGSAGATERETLERHLAECADCRDEYAFQCRLHAGIAAEAPAPVEADAQDGLRRLLARMDAETAAAPLRNESPRTQAARGFRLGGRALIAAVVVQAIGLALFAVVLLQRERAPAYRTLTSAPAHATQATIRLVPAPTLTLAELQKMLAAENLRIVESNAGGSIYGLASETDAPTLVTAELIERLRRQPGVLLVEPIGASPSAH